MKTLPKSITDLLPKQIELVSANYDDSLDNSLDKVQEAIRKQDWYPLDSIFEDDWYFESQDYGVQYALDELKDDIVRNFDVDEERAEMFIQDHLEEIREEIYNRDCSDVMTDMIRHTSDPVCFYDTGVEIEFDVPFGTEEDLKACLKEVKSALKIKSNKWDSELRMMIEQGYSGRLVVYFKGDIREMMSLSGKNCITFKNPMVAIINTYQGSGDNTDLPGHEFTLSLDPENIFLDRNLKYSYTYDVCGMVESWCDCTDVKFHSDKRRSGGAKKSSLASEQGKEQELTRKFKETGKCTPLDMDMKRHNSRDLYYENNFPCGTHCKSCGTFWID